MGSTTSPAGIWNRYKDMQRFIFWSIVSIESSCAQELCLTCKHSDSGMSVCSNKMEVSLLVLATTALLVLPLPALFAMMCSDSWRSCDSSGMSRRRKTTSKRESNGEPILRTRVQKHKNPKPRVHANTLNKLMLSSLTEERAECYLTSLTSDSQRQSCLCCNVLQLGSQPLQLRFGRAERTLYQPWPDSQTAAPWLLAEPAVDYPTYQTRRCSTDLKRGKTKHADWMKLCAEKDGLCLDVIVCNESAGTDCSSINEDEDQRR